MTVNVPASRLPERHYIVETLLTHFLGVRCRFRTHEHAFTEIALADTNSAKRIRLPDHFLCMPEDIWLQHGSLTRCAVTDVTVANLQTVALFGLENAPQPIAPGCVYIPFDLFGAAFFLLTRYEEYVIRRRDSFERPLLEALPTTQRLIDRPVVNEYVDILAAFIERLWPGMLGKGREYRLELSHDVDEFSLRGRRPGSVALSLAADLLQRREPTLAARRAAAYAATVLLDREVAWDPYQTFDFLMDTSERAGVRSTFFFVSEISKPGMDPRYRLSDRGVLRVIDRIGQRGHAMGLHGSFESSNRPLAFVTELHALKQACASVGVRQDRWGARQHFLRLRIPETWAAMAAAGIAFDASLGFANREGFRASCCDEFPVWDLLNRARLPLLAQPLVVMDVSVLSHQRRTLDELGARTVELAATCRRFRGCMSLLWHNHNLASRKSRRVYRDLVAAIS